jgi:molecular chaperone DnaK
VSAKDKGTGKEQQIRIQASGGLADADIDKMVKEAEQFAEEDKKRRAGAEAKNQAESLIHATERQLAEHGDKVGPDVKTEIETALAEAKTAVEGGDPEQMTQKTNALTQAAMKLGQAMYEQQQAQTDAAADADAGTSTTGEEAPAGGQEEVVDAEFSEVDEETKGS